MKYVWSYLDSIIWLHKMAKDISQFFPYIQTAEYGWEPPQDLKVYYIRGFDRSSASYIV